MKRFAANRIYDVFTGTVLRNGVVEVDESSHEVIQMFDLEGEISHTEWKGGVILLCHDLPVRKGDEPFMTFLQRTRDENLAVDGNRYAYHISAFNVNAMEFTTESRIWTL